MLIITASNIMRREIAVLREEDSLEHVACCMKMADLRQVPVVDGTRLVGMLDERDMAHLQPRNQTDASKRLAARLCERTFVANVMRRKVPTVRVDESVNEVLSWLCGYRCDTLFVVDDSQNLVGIVTRKEVSAFVELVLSRATRVAQRRLDRRVQATAQRHTQAPPSDVPSSRRGQCGTLMGMRAQPSPSSRPTPRRRQSSTLRGVSAQPPSSRPTVRRQGGTLIGMRSSDDDTSPSPSSRRRVA